MAKKRDYADIRLEYANGTDSLRELAVKHGVSANALMKRSEREKWTADRRIASAAAALMAQQELTRRRATELADWNANDIKMALMIRGQVARAVDRLTRAKADGSASTIDPNTLRTLAASVESAQRIARLAMGANTDSHAVTGADGVPLNAAPPTLTDFYQTLSVVGATVPDVRAKAN